MRKKLLMGNWKMNKTIADAKTFASASRSLVVYAHEHNIDVGVAPTYLCLSTVKEQNPAFIVCAQNCHALTSGAYTGEISAEMLQAIGVEWVLLGHSERRQYDNETSVKCNQKIKHLLSLSMTPLYCFGETEKEFEAGKTKEVVHAQLVEGLSGLTLEEMKHIVLAYEPVWSIGTGKNASQEIAESVCAYVRSVVDTLYPGAGEVVRILYGGSVKPNNIHAYLTSPNIDGALVGGASLTVESYDEMVRALVAE